MKKSTIYREDAIDAVHKYFNDAINNEPSRINKDGYDVFIDAKSVNALLYHNKMVSKALSALPSAEAKLAQAEKCEDCIHNGTNKDKITCKECASSEAVQGEWVDKGDDAECSRCGAHSGTKFDGVEPIPLKTKFCHNCGAKMWRE